MNYYEELGIRSDADEEEIRKAHRRLVKLMHPDQHRDATLKALAETQMRRLNSIVSTLLDPDERHEYDEQLRGAGGDPLNPVPQQSSWKAVPWWIASTLGAIILTVGTLWFFADRMGPSRHDKTPPPDVADIATNDTPSTVKVPVPPASTPAQPVKQGKPQEEIAAVQVPPPAQQVPNTVKSEAPKPEPVKPPPAKPVEVIKAPEVSKAVKPPVEPARKPVLPPPVVKETVKKPAVAHESTPPPALPHTPHTPPKVVAHQTPPVIKPVKPSVTTPPAAPSKVEVAKNPDIPRPYVPPATPPPAVAPPKETLVAAAPPPPPAPTPSPAPTAGDIPKPDHTPTPPVTNLSHDPLEGEWVYAPTEPEKRRPGLFPPEFIQLKLVKDPNGMRGEYSARYNVDKPVSPDVNFVLKATDQTAMKYVWTAANGAHGWMMIRDLDTDTMRLEWKDTSKHNGQQLTSGQATLVRKN
jgi:hypothetical protein